MTDSTSSEDELLEIAVSEDVEATVEAMLDMGLEGDEKEARWLLARIRPIIAQQEREKVLRGVVSVLGLYPTQEMPGAFDKEPPAWAQDPFNDDCASKCGYCGSWMSVVRPGKVQCDTCGDGTDLYPRIARFATEHGITLEDK